MLEKTWDLVVYYADNVWKNSMMHENMRTLERNVNEFKCI